MDVGTGRSGERMLPPVLQQVRAESLTHYVSFNRGTMAEIEHDTASPDLWESPSHVSVLVWWG